MDCQEARDRLTLLVCNGIALTDLALLGAHMKGCAACGREIDRRRTQTVPLGESLAAWSGRLRQAGSPTIAATRVGLSGVRGLAMLALSLPGLVYGASTRLAAGVMGAVVTAISRVLLLPAAILGWPPLRAPAAGFVLTTALILSTPDELAQHPAGAGDLLAAPPAEPPLAPPEAVPGVVPPADPEPAARAAEVKAAPGPAPAVPESGSVAQGAAPAVPRTRPSGPSTAPPAGGASVPAAPLVAEPGPGDVTVPDVIGRLWVANLEAAERDVAALLQRVGGTEVGRRRGPTSTMLEAVVPSAGYAELYRGLAAMGSWLVEAQRSALPDGIRITIRLSQSAPPRAGGPSVP